MWGSDVVLLAKSQDSYQTIVVSVIIIVCGFRVAWMFMSKVKCHISYVEHSAVVKLAWL